MKGCGVEWSDEAPGSEEEGEDEEQPAEEEEEEQEEEGREVDEEVEPGRGYGFWIHLHRQR